MATLEELVVQLTAETSQLQAQMKTATKVTEDSADKMAKAIGEFSESSSKNTSFFQQSMATLTGFLGSQAVLGVIGLVKDAFAALGEQLQHGVEDASKQEEASVRLANALQLTGRYSKETQGSLEEFANQMESLTNVNDDVVISNLAVLTSMTKLTGDGLQQAEKAALGLSSAYGIDLDTAVKLVGKGIDGNTDAFKRYGITIEQGANQAENLANIVKKIPFDAAAGATMTYQGALKGLQNAWGNVVEVLGSAVVNNSVVISVFKTLTGVLGGFEEYLKSNSEVIKKDFASAILFAIDVIKEITSFFNDLITVFVAGFQTIKLGANLVIDSFSALNKAIHGDLSGAMDAFTNTGKTWDDLVKTTTKGTGALNPVLDVLTKIGDNGKEAFEKMDQAAAVTAPTIKKAGAAIQEITRFQQMQKDAVNSLADSYLSAAASVLDASTLAIGYVQAQYDAQLISFEQYSAQLTTLQQGQHDSELAALQAKYGAQFAANQEYQIAAAQLEAQYSTTRLKAATDLNNQQKAVEQTRLANTSSFFGNLAVLSQSSNKEIASIGKAAAIAQATVDGYAAIQKALAAAPPPFNFALAASVGVATAANIAKISGVGFAHGTDSVPGTGNQDSVPAMLTPGERVLTQDQNKDLTAFLNEQTKGGANQVIVNFNVNIAPGTGINEEQAAHIMDGLNNLIKRGGNGLISA